MTLYCYKITIKHVYFHSPKVQNYHKIALLLTLRHKPASIALTQLLGTH